MFVCMCNYGKQIKFQPGSSAWIIWMFNFDLQISDFDSFKLSDGSCGWCKLQIKVTTSPDLSRQVGE